MGSQQVQALLKSLRWLQTSHEYSDLKIFCQDKVFQVHKAIVCSRSKYFATSCKWGKSNAPKEEIDLADEDATLVGLMLDYLYQLNYDDLQPSRAQAEPTEASLVQPEATQAPKFLFRYKTSAMTPVAVHEPVLEPELPIVEPIEEALEEAPAPEEEAPVEVPEVLEALPAPEEEAPEEAPEEVPEEEAPVEVPEVLEASPAPEEAPEAPLEDDSWWMPSDKKKKRKKMKGLRPSFEDQGHDVNTERLVVNTLMYAMADKYEIDGLKDLAREKFEVAVRKDRESKSFVRATELAFETTPSSDRGLRTIIIKTMNKHRDLMDYEEFQDLFNSGNGIAWALLQVIIGGPEEDIWGPAWSKYARS